ncbi:hypothetical protein EVAR_20586_1 [Eumeta japonica]|uniref:Uncharacterized protein n=1 Tax=Eumeta variegata TaxID=151549 RepID=A0A4C1URW9_EUMVA|nr:hypothetical protein EVAR_20586_1 [Eumeta japonica]
MMQRFASGDSNPVYDIITGDESCIYCYNSETKRQSTQKIFSFEKLPIKVKRGRSVGKKDGGLFLRNYAVGHYATIALEDKKTVTADRSSNLDVKLLTLVQCRLGAVRKRRYQRDDYIQSEPLRLSMLKAEATEAIKLEIREHFLAFCPIIDTTGAGLMSFIIEKLDEINLDINNLRDRAMIMDKICAVRIMVFKRLLDLNPRFLCTVR